MWHDSIRDTNILMKHKVYILNLYMSYNKAHSAHNTVIWIKFNHDFPIISNQSAICLKKWNIHKLLKGAKMVISFTISTSVLSSQNFSYSSNNIFQVKTQFSKRNINNYIKGNWRSFWKCFLPPSLPLKSLL